MSRFWNFVLNFWTPHGGYDYCDEWYPTGGFYANLSSKTKIFKTIFPYRLELSESYTKSLKRKNYVLFVYIDFNHKQKMLLSKKKVTSKKEAIRQALYTIKQFESDKLKTTETWLKLRHKTPIINEKGIWVASIIIGDVSNTLYKSNLRAQTLTTPLGHGTFYKLDTIKLHWTKIQITSYGYSSCSERNIPIKIWLSLIGLDNELDKILKQIINYQQKNKLIAVFEDISSETKIELLLEKFIKKHTINQNEMSF